jgi:hypothetical protein
VPFPQRHHRTRADRRCTPQQRPDTIVDGAPKSAKTDEVLAREHNGGQFPSTGKDRDDVPQFLPVSHSQKKPISSGVGAPSLTNAVALTAVDKRRNSHLLLTFNSMIVMIAKCKAMSGDVTTGDDYLDTNW